MQIKAPQTDFLNDYFNKEPGYCCASIEGANFSPVSPFEPNTGGVKHS